MQDTGRQKDKLTLQEQYGNIMNMISGRYEAGWATLKSRILTPWR